MKKRIIPVLTAVLLIATLILCMEGLAGAESVKKISPDELKAMLGKPDLVILDVRAPKDWQTSALKIVGAAWEDSLEVDQWASKYPKDKTIVLYCS